MSYCYIEAPDYTPLPEHQPSIFLGGGITGVEDWQSRAKKVLQGLGDITICNPRREFFNISNDTAASAEQIKWEHTYLDKVNQVIFWFGEETIQPIVLFELGARLRENKWRAKGQRQAIFIGCNPKYKRKLDVFEQAKLEGYKTPIDCNLDALLENVLDFNHLYHLVH